MNEESKSTSGPKRSAVALTSARQMRALAHPLRLRILGELRLAGPRTVGMLSGIVDEAPGTLSYHLGKLAEFGFVEEAPELAADRRERWWRAAHEVTELAADGVDTPPGERQAAAVVRHLVVDVYAATLHRVVDAEQPRAWAEAATAGDTVAYLTADELAQASKELRLITDKWRARGAQRRNGAEPVQMIVHAFRRP